MGSYSSCPSGGSAVTGGFRSPGWYATEAQSVASKQISFMHAGALRRTREYELDLCSSFEAMGMSVSLQKVGGSDFSLREDSDVDVIVVAGLENGASQDGAIPLIETMRPQLSAIAATGTRVLMTSMRPLTWFRAPLGSSLLADSAIVRFHRLDAEQLSQVSADLDDKHLAVAIAKSGGAPGLLEDFLVVNRMEASNSEKLRHASGLTKTRLGTALTELDNGCLAILEEVALRLRQEVLEDALAPDAMMQALLDSGLCDPDHSGSCVRIFDVAWRIEARFALEDAISAVAVPPREWTQIAADLFSIERTIRRAVGINLQDEFGSEWCTAGLGPKAESILNLALADGFVAVENANDVANPLDYLLLDDLLELACERSTSAPLLGLGSARWRLVKNQLIPIRNRFAHMRIPQPRDAAIVRVALKSLRS